MKSKLVLASASPRRKELLGLLSIAFECVPADIDEVFDGGLKPIEVARYLALEKAKVVASRVSDSLVEALHLVTLSADTIVVGKEVIYGKPTSQADAARILQNLSGQWHEVMTGVAVISENGSRRVLQDVERTAVLMRALSPAEIEAYVATGEPMDKAGAYALQGVASIFIERIEGCYTNVIGLPMPKTAGLLREAGLTVLGSKMC